MYLAIEASLPSEETEQMQKHANLDEHLDSYITRYTYNTERLGEARRFT